MNPPIHSIKDFFSFKQLVLPHPSDTGLPYIVNFFEPNIKKILSSELCLDVYKATYSLSDGEEEILRLIVIYYLFNTSYPTKKEKNWRSNPLGKNRRPFNKMTFFNLENFNPEIRSLKKNNLMKFVLPHDKEVTAQKRFEEILNQITPSSTPLLTVLKNSMFKEEFTIDHSPQTVISYFKELLLVSKKMHREAFEDNYDIDEIQAGYKTRRKKFADEGFLTHFKKDRSFELLTETTKKLFDDIKNSNDEDKVRFDSQILQHLDDFELYLSQFSKSKIPGLRTQIVNWREQITDLRKETDREVVLQYLIDQFYPKDSLRMLLLRISEATIHILISTFSKYCFRESNVFAKLIKHEVRLTIFASIGLPCFGYRLPVMDLKFYEQFFEIFPDSMEMLIKQVIFREKVPSLELTFRKFLFFYPLWCEIVESSDEYHKMKINKSDYGNDHEERLNNRSIESVDDNVIDDELSLHEESVFDSSIRTTIEHDFIVSQEEEVLNREFEKRINAILTEKEIEYFKLWVYKGLNQIEIAQKMGKSQPNVSKTIDRLLQKIRNDKNCIKWLFEMVE